MQNKKKIISLCLAFVLLFAAVGGTIAYLTDHDQKENVFTVGKIDINLFEQVGVTDALGNNVTAEKVIETENGSQFINLLPGNVVTKTPTIHNNGGNDAYVRVVVEVENKGDLVNIMDKAIDQVFEDEIGKNTDAYNNFYNTIFDGWGISYLRDYKNVGLMRFWMEQREDDKVLAIDSIRTMKDGGSWQFAMTNTFKSNDEENGDGAFEGVGYYLFNEKSYYDAIMSNDESKLIYVFYLKLESQDTYTLFDGFNVPESFDSQSLAFFDGLEVNIYADAIQTEGFASWTDAINALEAQHHLGWWN